MNPTGGDKSVIDRMLDAGVFAPLGLLITRDQVRDDVVAAGRKQVAFARSLGRAALQGFTRRALLLPQRHPAAPVVVEVPGLRHHDGTRRCHAAQGSHDRAGTVDQGARVSWQGAGDYPARSRQCSRLT